MSYSKKFFGVVLLLIGLIAGCLVILQKAHSIGLAVAMVIVSVTAAVLGRVSGTLGARFESLSGAVFAKKPILRLVGKISGRDLQPAATLGTSAGCVEIGYEEFGYEQVKSQLITEGHSVTELRLENAEFDRYLEQARYDLYHPTYYQRSHKYLAHKQVQHYASLLLAPINAGLLWMDVASSTSPFHEILTRVYGITVYRQDLSYRPGREGLCIGSDACQMPIDDGLVDRVSLHCGFEHFEGNSDEGFFQELARILRPGGIGCVVPLYVCDEYQILTNPRYWLSRGIPREDGAKIVASRNYWESHGRFYDSVALKRRVLSHLSGLGLSYSLYEVLSPEGVNYAKFLALKIVKPIRYRATEHIGG